MFETLIREKPVPEAKESSLTKIQASLKAQIAKGKLPDLQFMKQFVAEVGRKQAEAATVKAQKMIYDALETPSSRSSITLLKKALAISPLCADSFVYLSEWKAKSLEEKLDLYQRGLDAGELALGPRTFKEDIGYFWGLLETRPYMRARKGLAETLWLMGQKREAIDHYQAMLQLNPNDNQGVRYLLATRLFILEEFSALKTLLQAYEDDGSMWMIYTQALVAFRNSDPKAAALAQEAYSSNKYVPEMLKGARELVVGDNEYVMVGSEDEATHYIAENRQIWDAVAGSIDWLFDATESCRLEEA